MMCNIWIITKVFLGTRGHPSGRGRRRGAAPRTRRTRRGTAPTRTTRSPRTPRSRTGTAQGRPAQRALHPPADPLRAATKRQGDHGLVTARHERRDSARVRHRPPASGHQAVVSPTPIRVRASTRENHARTALARPRRPIGRQDATTGQNRLLAQRGRTARPSIQADYSRGHRRNHRDWAHRAHSYYDQTHAWLPDSSKCGSTHYRGG